jgi:NitT/TauT family transport system ATP-binding protein
MADGFKGRPFIEVAGLTVNFPLEDRLVRALEDVSFAIAENEFVALIGPSGCGKTTVLNVLAGVVAPTAAGRLTLGGRPLEAAPRGTVGYVFQDPILLPWRTIAENVRLPLEVLGLQTPEYQRRVEDLLAMVGLTAFARGYPKQLSGGMKQRAGIARGLVFNPSLLLMDEPFAALDEITRTNLNTWLQELWLKTRKTVVLVTHNVLEAVFLADKVIVMASNPGRIKEVLPVNLPRPRTLEMFSSPAFVEEAAAIRESLHREAGPAEALP